LAVGILDVDSVSGNSQKRHFCFAEKVVSMKRHLKCPDIEFQSATPKVCKKTTKKPEGS
jgi:hypothetical protein